MTDRAPVRIAYADPPYLGMAAKFYGDRHPDAAAYDKIEAHAALIERLSAEFDRWALSMASTNLRDILPLCPPDARVMSWVKPFASFKPGVPVAYAWEPIVVRGAKGRADRTTVRDWCAENITLKRGFPGAKPRGLCLWLFDVLGARPTDEFVDLFPGSGAVGDAWREFSRQDVSADTPLFAAADG